MSAAIKVPVTVAARSPEVSHRWLTFESVEDARRVADYAQARSWRVNAEVELHERQEGGVDGWVVSELDTFGAGGCLAWCIDPVGMFEPARATLIIGSSS